MSSINMPSDERTKAALAALEGPREAFRSALVSTVEQLRAGLAAATAGSADRGRRVSVELGPFGSGRIDPDRFATFLSEEAPPDADTTPHLQRAIEVLESLVAREDALFFAQVPEGGDLLETVRRALGESGRAFGAARTAELARTGRYHDADHRGWIDHFPPDLWNRRERDVAPPLVVEVRGEDLRAGALAELLDGAQKVVLVVNGAAPPAPLTRLVTPGVHVMQTADPAALARLGATDGPAVGALVPEGCARFEHRPGSDGPVAARLVVESIPEDAPSRPLGRISAFRQAEDLRQLVAWRAAPVSGPVADGGPPDAAPATEADLLAAWILRQAETSDA
jgi:hypothetical protein